MEQEQLEHGHKLTLRDVLAALRKRGRDVEADKYKARFVKVLCPPFTQKQVLDLPFKYLCAATTLLQQSTFLSDNTTDQTREGSEFRYGVWYLKQQGKWRQS